MNSEYFSNLLKLYNEPESNWIHKFAKYPKIKQQIEKLIRNRCLQVKVESALNTIVFNFSMDKDNKIFIQTNADNSLKKYLFQIHRNFKKEVLLVNGFSYFGYKLKSIGNDKLIDVAVASFSDGHKYNISMNMALGILYEIYNPYRNVLLLVSRIIKSTTQVTEKKIASSKYIQRCLNV